MIKINTVEIIGSSFMLLAPIGDGSIRLINKSISPKIDTGIEDISFNGNQHLTSHILSDIAKYTYMVTMSMPISEFVMGLMGVLFLFSSIVQATVCDLSI